MTCTALSDYDEMLLREPDEDNYDEDDFGDRADRAYEDVQCLILEDLCGTI